MRFLLISAASLAALSVSPVAAQSYYPGNSGSYADGQSRMAVPAPWQIRSMIDAAERRGEISRYQADSLRDQADQLIGIDRRARRDGGDYARRDVTRRSFSLLRQLREARTANNGGYAYRGGNPGYPPPSSDDYRYGRSAPGDDDDSYTPPPSSSDPYRTAPQYDPYRSAPRNYDPNRVAPENYDPNRAAPDNYDPNRAAPRSDDDQGYDDPDGQDDGMTPPDDGIYRPRSN